MCRSKNAGVAGYAEAFRPVQSDSQTSEGDSYFENDVLDQRSWLSIIFAVLSSLLLFVLAKKLIDPLGWCQQIA